MKAGHLPPATPVHCPQPVLWKGDCSAPALTKALFGCCVAREGGRAALGGEKLISCRGRDQLLAIELKAAFREFSLS